MKRKIPQMLFAHGGKVFFFLISISAIIIFIPLLLSVFQSGYGYQFDSDELQHVHLAYLYTKGLTPYKDIYNSFYTPLFGWLLAPVFWVFGFTITSIQFARYVMILLLIIRLIASYSFIRFLWGKRTALFFLPLFLFDPFAVFSGMQIRPDNFMLTVYTVGLALVVCGMIRNKRFQVLAGTALLSVSLIILMKILPSLIVLALSLVLFYGRKKNVTFLVQLGIAATLPVVAFILYGVGSGGLREMVMQILLEAKDAYSVFRIPVPYGAFHRPDNIWVYGAMGMPLSWVYIWILPLAGVAGAFQIIRSALNKASLAASDVLKLALVGGLLVQWVSMFLVPVVFLQHYLLINWLLALFSAVLCSDLVNDLARRPGIRMLYVLALFGIYTSLVKSSITSNIARSTIVGADTITAVESRWKQIPPNEAVFPHFLFRPQVYPIPYGYFIGNVPESVFRRLSPIPLVLAKNNINHLLLDDYALGLLPADARDYITANYQRVPNDTELMERK